RSFSERASRVDKQCGSRNSPVGICGQGTSASGRQNRRYPMFDVSRYVLVVLALVGSAVTLAAVAAGSDTHASGRLCGVNACADLPSTIAVEMAQRGDSFSPASKPRPRPYYKVRVTSDGTEGYISLYVVWVPSKHVFRMKEYVTPPL